MRYRFYPGARWFVFLFLFLFAVSGCSGNKAVTRIKPIMGTYVQITVIAQDKRKAEEAIGKAFSKIEEIDYLMSTYKPDSEISRLNRLGELEVSPLTLEIVEKALEFSRLTDGALDISYKPIMDVWENAQKQSRLPTDEELKEAASLVNYRNIYIQGDKIKFKRKRMSIDLSCIAKGYAVDKGIDVLKEEGISNALVNAGGDIYALGSFSPKINWRVGIQHPRDKGRIIGVAEISNRAVATSGDYERYFTIRGKRYSVIFDPKTGESKNEIISATVIAPDCTTADALSTASFILGRKAISLVNTLKGVEALLITKEGKIISSRGADKFLTNLPKSLGILFKGKEVVEKLN